MLLPPGKVGHVTPHSADGQSEIRKVRYLLRVTSKVVVGLGWTPGCMTLMPVLIWLLHSPATKKQSSQVHSSMETLNAGRLTQTEESLSNRELLPISVLPQNSHMTLVSLQLALSLR